MARTFCKNCGRILDGDFCSNCGQRADEQRIDFRYFLQDMPRSMLNIDGLFLRTLLGLFTKPGTVVSEYLDGKRVKYIRPVSYVMVMTALSAILVKLLTFFKEQIMTFIDPRFKVHETAHFFEIYFSLFIFLMIPFASVITWLFFFKAKYNFWEHIIANIYIAAQLNYMWIFIQIVSIVGIVFIKHYFTIDLWWFFMFFMMLFLYLYGSVFGFLMSGFQNIWKLIVRLTLMNLALFYLYSIGFQIAGLL